MTIEVLQQLFQDLNRFGTSQLKNTEGQYPRAPVDGNEPWNQVAAFGLCRERPKELQVRLLIQALGYSSILFDLCQTRGRAL